MSIGYMVVAFKAKVKSPLTKLVLIKLADNANDDGLCFPSYQHIADQCEISRQSAINHVKILHDLGVLEKVPRMKNGENTSNQFFLSMKKMVELSSQPNLPPSQPPVLGSQPDLPPSQPDRLGVVNHVDPEPSLLTIKEPSINQKPCVASVDATRIAEYFSSKILANDPKAKTKPDAWANDIDKLIRIDGRSPQEIITVINWIYSAAGSFWTPNILSGKKLREKFDTLRQQAFRRSPNTLSKGQKLDHAIERFLATENSGSAFQNSESIVSQQTVIGAYE